MGRGLINHDPRTRQYRAVDLLVMGEEPVTKTWVGHRAYDQGQTPECVAFTGKGCLNTAPISSKWSYNLRSKLDTEWIYQGAKLNDEWAGENYDGTSGLGLMRFLKSAGYIESYHACFSLDEYLLTLSHIGPIAFGVWWREGMWDPDANGFLHPTGDHAGGHEFTLYGVNMEEEYVMMMNSWGRTWGQLGHAKIRFDDLATLIGDDADGYTITA